MIQIPETDYRRPNPREDRLFSPDYTQRHQDACEKYTNAISCDAAVKLSWKETRCDAARLAEREHPGMAANPNIFIRNIGIANTVMKSAADRDRLAAQHDIIAFEMEAVGVWEEVPCIVVKGMCDYADSHKNKKCQNCAAATAAYVAVAVTDEYVPKGL